jgi:hypothetical protein
MRTVVPEPGTEETSSVPPIFSMFVLTTSIATPRPDTLLMCRAVERPGAKIDWPTRDRSFARIVPWSSGRVRRLWRVVSGSCGAIIGDLDCSKQMHAYLQFTKAAQLLRNIPDTMGTNSSSHMASTQPPRYSTPRRIRQELGAVPRSVEAKMLLRAEQSCKARPFVWGICLGHSLAQKKSNHPFGPGSVGRP